MASMKAIVFSTLALSASPVLACDTLGVLAHGPDGVFVIRKTTPDNIEAQCGSVVDACVIHRGGTDYILIRNDLPPDQYRCALLHQYANINARQI